MSFLYDDTASSHPIVEYHPDAEDTSDIPSFVLDVTWSRIVQYYHPSSKQCINFAREFVQTARNLRHRIIRGFVEFHAVNCDVHVTLCESEGIDVVPTIVWYDQGSIESQVLKRSEGNTLDPEYVASEIGLTLKKEQKRRGDNKGDAKRAQSAELSPLALEENNINTNAKNTNNNDVDRIRKESSKNEESDTVDMSVVASEIYADAIASFVTSISSSIYPRTLSLSSSSSLPPDRADAFHSLLDLFHWALPHSWSLAHDLINDLRNDFESVTRDVESLREIVQRYHLLPSDGGFDDNDGASAFWTRRCTSDTFTYDEESGKEKSITKSGYSCGLWGLFHVSTVGVAERHADVLGVAAAEQRREQKRRQRQGLLWWWRKEGEDYDDGEGEGGRVSTSHGAKVIRDYVDLFFGGCEVCRRNFLHMYDSCGFNVCQRMTAHAEDEDGLDGIDWRELALWLWEVHNDVNIRKGSSTAFGYENGEVVDGKINYDHLLWPSKEECPECRVSDDHSGDGSDAVFWNMDAVYNHLKKTYWPKSGGTGVDNPHLVVLGNWNKQNSRKIRTGMLPDSAGTSGIGMYFLFVVLLIFLGSAVVIIWTSQSHRHLRWGAYTIWNSGRHKKKKRKKTKKKKKGFHDYEEGYSNSYFHSTSSVPFSGIGNGIVTQRGRKISGGNSIASLSYSTGRRGRHTFVDG